MWMAAWGPVITLTNFMKTLGYLALLGIAGYNLRAENKMHMETTNDTLAITGILEKEYFAGIYHGDTAQLRKIYHPGALLFGDVKGQPYAKTLDEYLDAVANRQSPEALGKQVEGSIMNIRVVNSIAVAEVKVNMYDFRYHEFLSFHKLAGKWLLVNKMMSDTAH